MHTDDVYHKFVSKEGFGYMGNCLICKLLVLSFRYRMTILSSILYTSVSFVCDGGRVAFIDGFKTDMFFLYSDRRR